MSLPNANGDMRTLIYELRRQLDNENLTDEERYYFAWMLRAARSGALHYEAQIDAKSEHERRQRLMQAAQNLRNAEFDGDEMGRPADDLDDDIGRAS